jgi:hypothetical protein
MFVGEEVDGIFEKIRKESALRNPASSGRYGRSGVSPPGNFARPGPASRQATRPASRSASRSAAAAPARPVALPAAAGAPVSALRSDPSPRLKAWNLGPAPRSRSSLPAAAPAEARTSLGSWHLAPTAYDNPPSARDAVRPAPSSVPRAADAPLPDPHPLSVRPAATPAPSAQAAPGDTTARTVSKPKWKERGFWIGSGAAVAVVGLTVYFAGGQQWNDPGGRSKVYGVPAKPTP